MIYEKQYEQGVVLSTPLLKYGFASNVFFITSP